MTAPVQQPQQVAPLSLPAAKINSPAQDELRERVQRKMIELQTRLEAVQQRAQAPSHSSSRAATPLSFKADSGLDQSVSLSSIEKGESNKKEKKKAKQEDEEGEEKPHGCNDWMANFVAGKCFDSVKILAKAIFTVFVLKFFMKAS